MKRLLCTMLILALLLSACGGAPAQTTAPAETTAPIETTTPIETTIPAETAAPIETTAPGVDNDMSYRDIYAVFNRHKPAGRK